MNKILLAFVLCFSSNLVFAFGMDTGKDILIACEKADAVRKKETSDVLDVGKAEACVSFLQGFDSGHYLGVMVNDEVKKGYCIKDNANFGQMYHTALEFLKANPKYHEAPAGIAVWKAFAEKWPCK